MTPALRWRIISLQVLLVIVFVFAAGFMFWAGNFTHSQITDQMKAQSISFPAKGDPSISAGALTPCANLAKGATCPIPTGPSVGQANASAMAKYAGQDMTTGDQAQTYANSFIQVHLADMGYTYSQISALVLAHPNNTTYQTVDATIFKGTTLRSMLLNAYGWWTVGTYAILASAGMLVAALVVLGALIYEVAFAGKREEVEVKARGRRAPSPPPHKDYIYPVSGPGPAPKAQSRGEVCTLQPLLSSVLVVSPSPGASMPSPGLE